MKNKIISALILFIVPTVAFANCGSVPEAPQLLEEVQLNSDQLISVGNDMSAFFETTASFKACVDDLIASIAPADATEEYFESTQYQSEFQRLFSYNELADLKMAAATERYNYLISIANGR
jgi:hypothetical protein